jgi:hypothetical protein
LLPRAAQLDCRALHYSCACGKETSLNYPLLTPTSSFGIKTTAEKKNDSFLWLLAVFGENHDAQSLDVTNHSCKLSVLHFALFHRGNLICALFGIGCRCEFCTFISARDQTHINACKITQIEPKLINPKSGKITLKFSFDSPEFLTLL